MRRSQANLEEGGGTRGHDGCGGLSLYRCWGL